jgi:hypothetical protein
MNSIGNISERNKIDTQSRADAYIRRNRLISKSDYISLDAPNSIFETEKNPKTPLFWANIFKKPSKTPKKPKNPKNPKKPTWLVFF